MLHRVCNVRKLQHDRGNEGVESYAPEGKTVEALYLPYRSVIKILPVASL